MSLVDLIVNHLRIKPAAFSFTGEPIPLRTGGRAAVAVPAPQPFGLHHHIHDNQVNHHQMIGSFIHLIDSSRILQRSYCNGASGWDRSHLIAFGEAPPTQGEPETFKSDILEQAVLMSALTGDGDDRALSSFFRCSSPSRNIVLSISCKKFC